MNEHNRKKYRKVDWSIDVFRALIDGLDLDALNLGIQKAIPEATRNPELLAQAKRRYRNFLYLCGVTGNVVVPTALIDAVWHVHILDTVKYAEDCERVFGFFLHHYPYFGLRGDEAELEKEYSRTATLYESVFGEAYTLQAAIAHDAKLAERLNPGDRNCG